MPSSTSPIWTNPSVRAFAGDSDPITRIEDAARRVVHKAREQGWTGPPFNPVDLAPLFGAKLRPNASLSDARVIVEGERTVIEYNPQQPRERMRFSIAHELAHLLFPDYHVEVRNRAHTNIGDGWQLEMLCNIAASEFVLPIGSLSSTLSEMTLEELMVERRRFDVSVEAFLIRVVKVSERPTTMFVASLISISGDNREYKIDYHVSSATAPETRLRNVVIPTDSAIGRCTAIGYTETEVADWATGESCQIEYVGIPGFPGRSYPRVAGLVRHEERVPSRAPIRYLHGNILDIQRPGKKIVCQLVNDRAIRWGGGTAKQFAQKFPYAEEQFHDAVAQISRSNRIGSVIFTELSDGVTLASIIGQEGFGPSLFPRIRYSAMESGIQKVARLALETGATVHLPRIGTGAAGGDWQIIEEILDNELVRRGVDVTVYDLPPKREQLELL